jgi:chlorobactene glucosyltransferase
VHPPDPDTPGERVSVLVPARNEEASIGACIEGIFASGCPVHEVVVFDDASTDETGAILARLQTRHPRLRIVNGSGLPDGWVGKPHACHRLEQEAAGDLLVYLDADVTLQPGGLARLLGLLEGRGLPGRRPDLVTAVPRQDTGSFGEVLLMPLLHLTYASWLPLLLIHLSGNDRFLAANGQVLAVRRPMLRQVGGWRAVRHEIVDDMALCRLVKRTGGKVVFADGHHMARCRMYRSFGELWKGFSKNLYEGIGAHPASLAFVLTLYTLCFVVPWVTLPVAMLLGAPEWATAAAAGVGLNLFTRLLLAGRHGHRLSSVLLHPIALLGFLGIALNSLRWHQRGAIEWAGRTYAARAQRSAS